MCGPVGTSTQLGACGAATAAAPAQDERGANAAGTTALATQAVAAAGTGNLLVRRAADGLKGSSIAQQVLQTIEANGARIETVPDGQFSKEFGARTAGAFDPKTNTISIPQSVANNPEKLRIVLLHEGVHWLQDNVAGGAEALGGPIGDALRAAGAIRQTAPGTPNLQHDEAQAYLLEAIVANEVGIRDTGLGVDANGRPLTYDAILQKIRATPEYS